jgi:hypothetical protein
MLARQLPDLDMSVHLGSEGPSRDARQGGLATRLAGDYGCDRDGTMASYGEPPEPSANILRAITGDFAQTDRDSWQTLQHVLQAV